MENNKDLLAEEMKEAQKAMKEDENKQGNNERLKPEQIIHMIEDESKTYFFHDQEKEGYAKVEDETGYQVYKIRSEEYRKYISSRVWALVWQAVPRETMNMVIQTLEAKAMFDGVEHRLHIRSVFHENNLWYDLGLGKAVKITCDGWEIINNCPILFKSLSHQEKQIEPVIAEPREISRIFNFLNLNNSIDLQILIMAYVCAVLVPSIARPLLVVHGLQGSAKSTFLRIIKKLLDPSILDLLTYPKNSTELIQILSHHYLVYFDNVSEIKEWLSDDLCRACTGQAFSKRKLYTDDDDIVYNYKRSIGINGINLVAEKPDLLDRSLIFELESISPDNRKEEETFWIRFAEEKPIILGAIFTTLSRAMKVKDSIVLEKKPRLADFAVWGCAISEALGYNKDAFLDSYNLNIEKQNAEALDASMVAQVIIGFMENKPDWKGSAKILLDELGELADEYGFKKDSHFPKSTRWLWRRVKEVKANLSSIGIEANYDDTSRPRQIMLVKKDS